MIDTRPQKLKTATGSDVVRKAHIRRRIASVSDVLSGRFSFRRLCLTSFFFRLFRFIAMALDIIEHLQKLKTLDENVPRDIFHIYRRTHHLRISYET